MLVLKKRHGSKFWTARGTYCGIKVDRSLGVTDKREAQAILAKIQAEIFERASGRTPSKGPTFAEAVISYVKNGGEKRFLEPLSKHFGEYFQSKRLTSKRLMQPPLLSIRMVHQAHGTGRFTLQFQQS